MRNLFILISLLCAQTLWAQQQFDVITLKDNTVLQGEILKYLNDGKVIKLKLQDGKKIFLREAEVASIEKMELNNQIFYKSRSLFETNQRRIYATTKVGILGGTATWGRGTSLGLSASASVGYQLHQFLALGVGGGVDTYNPSYNDAVFPIFGEIRGFIVDAPTLDVYYNINAGYGFIPRLQNNGRAEGGWLAHPSVGIRFGKSPNIGYTIDVGVRLQEASYSTNDWNGTINENVRYQRYALRFGMLF